MNAEAYMSNIRRKGLMSAYMEGYSPEGIDKFMKMAFALSLEEREEGSIDIIENITAFMQVNRQRIGDPVKILSSDSIPVGAPTGYFLEKNNHS